jgi:hypothetical protein
VMTATLLRVVLAPISIVGGAAWLVSVAMGLAVAAAWSGIGRQRRAGRAGTGSALGAQLAPVVTGKRTVRRSVFLPCRLHSSGRGPSRYVRLGVHAAETRRPLRVAHGVCVRACDGA